MKLTIFLFIALVTLVAIPTAIIAQTVGISPNGSYAPNNKAILDLDAAGGTKGFLLPRMTAAEITAFESGLGVTHRGMTVFNTTAGQYWYWDGSAWQAILTTGSAGVTLDQAYDFGGSGAGRTITADAGAVTIDGTDGLVSTGTFSSGAAAPSGAGTRMVWNPNKAAFRAGIVNGTQWDPANIGTRSAAFGENTRASGINSFAAGLNSVASGQVSVAIGNNTTASFDFAVAMGQNTTASASRSFAMGSSTTASGGNSVAFGASSTASGFGSFVAGSLNTASGDNAVALGRFSNALSFAETVFGIGATTYTPSINGATQFRPANATDRLFVVGNAIDANSNGTVDAGERSDALVILKNGNTGIGSSTPQSRLHVVGNIRMVDGNQAAGKVLTSDVNGTATWQFPTAGVEFDPEVNMTTPGQIPRWDGNALVDGIATDAGSGIGINTNAPSQPLDVVGGTILRGFGFEPGVHFNSNSGNSTLELIGRNVTGTANKIQLKPSGGGVEALTINEMGQIGVGFTTNPGASLDVGGSFKLQNGTQAAGRVLVSDNNGLATWQPATNVSSGTLDEAYDFGGPGAGRTIVADVGPVNIVGTDGLISSGVLNSGSPMSSTTDPLMAWNPRKAAFRAGLPDGSWSDGSIGQGSVAFGKNNQAMADFSTAVGRDNTASGNSSMVAGRDNQATGNSSMALGEGLTAPSFGEVAVGLFNTSYFANASTLFNSSDRLFVIGNGIGSFSRSDAMVVKKDGSTGLGVSNPTDRLEVAGTTRTESLRVTTGAAIGHVLQSTDASGAAQWVSPSTLSITENDPQVASTIVGMVPRWDGIALSDGIVFDNGVNVGIGTAGPNERLHVQGNVRMDGTITIIDGTQAAGKVLTSDVNGLASWQTPVSGGTTLDGSYDFGGAGAGRTITADAGAVTIAGVDGFVSTGTSGSGAFAPSGAGVRMVWNPRKAAFRAGQAFGASWDDANIGSSSAAFGSSTASGSSSFASGGSIASGTGSVALGFGANASAYASQGIGYSANATSAFASAIGYLVTASGGESTAIGSYSTASGNRAVTLGNMAVASGANAKSFSYYGTATSFGETVLGIGATDYIPNSSTSFGTAQGNDRLLVVGNAIDINNNSAVDAAERSDALVILKNGNTGIGSSTPADRLHVVGNIRMVDGNQASGKVLTSDANGTATWQTAASGGGTLDQSYDFGGAGAGRTITADAGAVLVHGADGFQVTGTLGSGATIDLAGVGTRMFFNPNKAAFRAGYVNGTHWNNANVGNYSVAIGYSTYASGEASVALGYTANATGTRSVSLGLQNNASGYSSTAFGTANTASGDYSTAFGNGAAASGTRSTAWGYASTASGSVSTSLGMQNTSPSYGEVVLGIGATTYTPSVNGATQFRTANATDRLLVVGNAIDMNNNSAVDAAERSDALVILKNGNTGIGSSTPQSRLHVVGNIRMVDGNQAVGRVMTSDANGTATWQDPATISGVTLDQAYDQGGAGAGRTITADAGAVTIAGVDGFVSTGTSGSGAVAPSGAGVRMVWNPRKAALRAGSVTGTQWDDANIGLASFASGTSNRASGPNSTSFGQLNLASGSSSLASGQITTASGNISTAIGFLNSAIGDHSFAAGSANSSHSFAETVLGIGASTYTPSTNGSTQFRTANATDRVLVVGNAIDANNNNTVDAGERSDALVILKNGNTGISTSTPTEKLEVKGKVLLTDGFTTTTAGLTYRSNTDFLFIGPNSGLSVNGAALALYGSTNTAGSNANGFDINTPNGGRVKMNMTNGGFNFNTNSTSTYTGSFEINDTGFDFSHNSASRAIRFLNSGGERMRIEANGRVGIGTAAPAFQFEVSTNSAAKPTSSAWTVSSDARLKKDVKPFEDGLELVQKIDPVWFTYNGLANMPQETGVGTIAQQLQKVAPYMVREWEHRNEQGQVQETYLGVDYGAMDFVLLNAIKELNAKVDATQEENRQLRALIQQLIEERGIDGSIKARAK